MVAIFDNVSEIGNKGYDIIISVDDITNKTLLRVHIIL